MQKAIMERMETERSTSMVKLRIDKLIVREKHGAKGPYTQLSVLSNKEWYTAFGGDWNSNWSEGMTIDAEVVEKPNPKGGVYKNIQAPQKVQPSKRLLDNSDQLNRIEARVNEMLVLLKASFGEEPPPLTDEDAPNYEDGSDIPF